jgi:hypothetical protein
MNTIKKIIRISAALMLSTVIFQQGALAVGPEVELHLTSLHFDNQSDFNTENFGIGINYPIKQSEHYSFSAGTFDNSYDEQSFYLGVTAQYDFCKSEIWICSVGVIGGVITGYEDDVEDANPVQPVALPQFKIGYNGFTATTRFIPDLGENSENVLTLSIGKEF